jgi:hypothetical protein
MNYELRSTGCGNRHLTLIGMLWSVPDTLVGVVFALLSGTVPRPRAGLLVAESHHGLARAVLTRRGFGAITFGRVVISATPVTPRLLMHEAHHARQYEVLGPFFLPLYLWLHARHGYGNNPLEREAEACAVQANLSACEDLSF